MERLTERVETERLYVIFQIGVRLLVVRARESAELRRRHAHRPTAAQRIFEADFFALPKILLARVLRVFAPLTLKTARICR